MKHITSFFCILLCLSIFSGCSQQNTTPTEYTSKSGEYAITLPGNSWIIDTSTSNSDLLKLYSDQQKNIIILIQKFPKDVAADTMGLDSLDKFMTFYQENISFAGLSSFGPPTEQTDIILEQMLTTKAYEYTAESKTATMKLLQVYAETTDDYYACAITADEKIYQKNISTLKDSLKSLTEKTD